MDNFTFYAPTYFAFGKGEEKKAGSLVKRFGGTKVLLHSASHLFSKFINTTNDLSFRG